MIPLASKSGIKFAAPVGFAGRRNVNVHVNEAGDQEFSVGVENLGAAGNGDGVRSADVRDAIFLDDYGLIGEGRCAGHVNHRGVGDGDDVFIRR